MKISRATLLLLLTILLISCAGAKYKKVAPSELKTMDDFSKAKDQLADNYLYKANDFDLHVVNYASDYISETQEVMNKLSAFDSSIVFHSVEESELLTLALISKGGYYGEALDSIINSFLQAIDNHNSNIEKQKNQKILNGNSTKTERTLAQGIYFDDAKHFIISKAVSDEERDIMLLYAQFLLIKYSFPFRQHLYDIDELGAFDNGEKWYDKNKKKFLENHPNTKYRPFLDNITVTITED
ncbi:hypothetical protein [Fibrobacter sp. UBA4297]|uniref:hypothetical protein n=1 Tax=Fibrobacter sp. UBA4297 TaxID=1946536 RepID=UPI0025B8C713|nr:hypothetical protein [Fibrobacter sp. UBA4297]